MRVDHTAPTVGTLLLALVLGLGTAVAHHEPTASSGVKAATAELIEAVRRGDAGAVASLYTEDARVFAPMREEVRGREQIELSWDTAFALGVRDIELHIDELREFEGMAWQIGRFSMLAAEAEPLVSGRYISLWKKVDGRWRIHRDLANLSRID